MRSLVVYESMFGNTERVAEAIAVGLGEVGPVDRYDLTAAQPLPPADYDVIVVGGPTHMLTMSTRRSRRDAWARGARFGVIRTGMREWIGQLDPPGAVVVAAFDTRVGRRALHIPGSAARAATRALRNGGVEAVAPPRSFFVRKEKGSLRPGELEAARAWGRALAQRAADKTARRHAVP